MKSIRSVSSDVNTTTTNTMSGTIDTVNISTLYIYNLIYI